MEVGLIDWSVGERLIILSVKDFKRKKNTDFEERKQPVDRSPSMFPSRDRDRKVERKREREIERNKKKNKERNVEKFESRLNKK